MKKMLAQILMVIMIMALLAGCTQKNTEPTSAEQLILKDGTYFVRGASDSNDWVPELSITVIYGKITDAKYDEAAPIKKSENIEYQKNFQAQTKLKLLDAYAALQNGLIKAQDPSKVDIVAGATKSSASFKSLAEEALKNAKADSKYIDGDYTAKGSIDEKYWTPAISITVKDGKIASVKYDETSSRVFKNKSQDKAYIAKYLEKNSIDLLAVYDVLQKSLVEKQSPAKLDAIAGATMTSTNFIELAKQAVQKAK